jgi:ketosteroid isomerase-like protein
MTEPMNAKAMAEKWIAQWNSRDIEGVLDKFADDVVFRSPKAHAIVGTSEVVGKAALRAYWTKALDQIGALRFELDHAAFDAEGQELFIVYIATLGANRHRACERLRFVDGRVIDGEGLDGAPW